ncbi:hypothetical protein JTB14_011374 [Gonioctena quinquepunctata]|nr:hypothetical protein JTB14_011374 [Gonioctena quinquepunctata]
MHFHGKLRRGWPSFLQNLSDLGRVGHTLLGKWATVASERDADGSRYTSEALARAISDVKDKNKPVKGSAKA